MTQMSSLQVSLLPLTQSQAFSSVKNPVSHLLHSESAELSRCYPVCHFSPLQGMATGTGSKVSLMSLEASRLGTTCSPYAKTPPRRVPFLCGPRRTSFCGSLKGLKGEQLPESFTSYSKLINGDQVGLEKAPDTIHTFRN